MERVNKTPKSTFGKTDLAEFQAHFVPAVMAYAKSQGYGQVVRDALVNTGVDVPLHAAVIVRFDRVVPEGVDDFEEYGRQVAKELGGRFESIDTDFDNE